MGKNLINKNSINVLLSDADLQSIKSEIVSDQIYELYMRLENKNADISFCENVFEDKLWKDSEKQSIYDKTQHTYAKECARECEEYFFAQKLRNFPTIIEDSHYNPKDKNCLLNQTRKIIPKPTIPRTYYVDVPAYHFA